MREAKDCTTMAELRREIDRIDQSLVGLLVERAGYIDRAITLKTANGWPARIDSRVEEVIANVRAKARAEGLGEDLVEQLWRALVEWSIAREEASLGSSEALPVTKNQGL